MLQKTWANIVHATIGGNSQNYGDRIPGVWFPPKTRKLHICTALGTKRNYCHDYGSLPRNQYTNVQIRQTWNTKSKVYQYIITINGKVRRRVTNTRAQVFKNVKLWASDPWHKAADATVRNLAYVNLPNGKNQLLKINKLVVLNSNCCSSRDLFFKWKHSGCFNAEVS